MTSSCRPTRTTIGRQRASWVRAGEGEERREEEEEEREGQFLGQIFALLACFAAC